MATEQERNPIQIMLGSGGSKSGTLDTYFKEACERAEALTQNLAPYDETIDKAHEAMDKVDEELDALYERAGVLEQQRAELEGVINDANSTRMQIQKSHGQAMLDFNQVFFDKIADEFNTPALKDKHRSWDIDLQYMPAFKVMFVTEVLLDNEPKTPPAHGDGMSDWMDNVNN